jgi:hypothetical protein
MASRVRTASWISAPSNTPQPARTTANFFMILTLSYDYGPLPVNSSGINPEKIIKAFTGEGSADSSVQN